jgi:hypothetical protein
LVTPLLINSVSCGNDCIIHTLFLHDNEGGVGRDLNTMPLVHGLTKKLKTHRRDQEKKYSKEENSNL